MRSHSHEFFSRLKEELGKSKPSVEVLKELMMRTYPRRRKRIIQDNPCLFVTEILSDYPFLKRNTYVRKLFLQCLFIMPTIHVFVGFSYCKFPFLEYPGYVYNVGALY